MRSGDDEQRVPGVGLPNRPTSIVSGSLGLPVFPGIRSTTLDTHPTVVHTSRKFSIVKQRYLVEIILRKYGNSTVAVLPPAVLKDLGLSAGQQMTLSTTEEGQLVLTRKRRYVLADLIAQCDPKAPPPADLALWETARPVGDEVW